MDRVQVGGYGGVETALRRAASATGVDFDFLVSTARRESGFNANAHAPTSSAAGLFQFVDQTWLAMVKRHGAKYGLDSYANAIQSNGDGTYRVSDPKARQAVLNLRYDPQVSSLMAGELASDHAAYLRGRTGREPSAGELYAAHFLGPAGSARLIEANQTRPGASAAGLFPDAAQANRSLFYRDGRPATVGELYANLTRTGGPMPATTADGNDFGVPTLDFHSTAVAARMDRLRREQQLLAFMNQGSPGGLGTGDSLFGAQLLSGFGPSKDDSES